ncbi:MULTISPECIES: hypothetical protein [Lysinibacillus]|uniref:Uncharacterized protein n=1 Tax=Lysinibacillus boronitolerans JCM 21713 = 10a = NBRC 103108 TaxID=1294264 RepID=A0ABR4Y5E8_9BACI|nr:hypothetical protein [Lysinibacillus boronitolerans]KGR89211.1 hypothetical protein CD31_01205 [Lysinibacillus boronitolerans JCM 21713 = 10a = NBRC 103108]
MTQETTNKTNTKKQPENKKFSKVAFLESASSTKARLEYEVVLEDGKTYTKNEADKLVDEWKKKGVGA